MMEYIEEGSSYKQENATVLWDKVKHVKREIESGYVYHNHCYKLITNKTDVNRSKERFEIIKDESSNILNQTAEISSNSGKKLICCTPQTNKKRLCSSASIFNKEACIIFLSNEGAFYKVAFESKDEKMLDVAKKMHQTL